MVAVVIKGVITEGVVTLFAKVAAPPFKIDNLLFPLICKNKPSSVPFGLELIIKSLFVGPIILLAPPSAKTIFPEKVALESDPI